jgi:hypothetical protein
MLLKIWRVVLNEHGWQMEAEELLAAKGSGFWGGIQYCTGLTDREACSGLAKASTGFIYSGWTEEYVSLKQGTIRAEHLGSNWASSTQQTRQQEARSERTMIPRGGSI